MNYIQIGDVLPGNGYIPPGTQVICDKFSKLLYVPNTLHTHEFYKIISEIAAQSKQLNSPSSSHIVSFSILLDCDAMMSCVNLRNIHLGKNTVGNISLGNVFVGFGVPNNINIEMGDKLRNNIIAKWEKHGHVYRNVSHDIANLDLQNASASGIHTYPNGVNNKYYYSADNFGVVDMRTNLQNKTVRTEFIKIFDEYYPDLIDLHWIDEQMNLHQGMLHFISGPDASWYSTIQENKTAHNTLSNEIAHQKQMFKHKSDNGNGNTAMQTAYQERRSKSGGSKVKKASINKSRTHKKSRIHINRSKLNKHKYDGGKSK